MNWSDNLDGVHREIAAATDNPTRVMAGPGTGKSYAMKRRLMRLLAEEVDPESILAVTFTVTREFNDMKFTSSYKAKVDGDTMKGTMEAKFGEKDVKQEFEAKREKVKD